MLAANRNSTHLQARTADDKGDVEIIRSVLWHPRKHIRYSYHALRCIFLSSAAWCAFRALTVVPVVEVRRSVDGLPTGHAFAYFKDWEDCWCKTPRPSGTSIQIPDRSDCFLVMPSAPRLALQEACRARREKQRAYLGLSSKSARISRLLHEDSQPCSSDT